MGSFVTTNFQGIIIPKSADYYDTAYVDYDAVATSDDSMSEDEVLEERDPAFLNCKISLFSKTYLRGENFSLDIANSDTNETLAIKDLSEGNE